MPNFKRIGGGPWKNGQKSVDLTWNDPAAKSANDVFWDYSISVYFGASNTDIFSEQLLRRHIYAGANIIVRSVRQKV